MQSLIREDRVRLVVNLVDGKVTYRRMELDMTANRLALYAFFALVKKACPASDRQCRSCDRCFLTFDEITQRQPEVSRLYKQLCGTRPIDEMSKTGILGLDQANFNSLKSRIKEDLLKAFGPMALENLEIASVGRRPDTRFGIRLAREVIEVVV